MTTVEVIDTSEDTEAEIAWGFNTRTGDWCASIYFGEIPEDQLDFSDD